MIEGRENSFERLIIVHSLGNIFLIQINIFTLNKKKIIIHPYLHKSDIYKDQTCIYRHFVVTNHERYNPKVTFVFSDLFVEAKGKKK